QISTETYPFFFIHYCKIKSAAKNPSSPIYLSRRRRRSRSQISAAVSLPLERNQMSSSPSKQDSSSSSEAAKPKKKICCACPETKQLRDECIVEHGESACAKWIEAHRMCLRAEGFNV
ncbi:Cytochrome c oxidase copper chaperone 1, partial [Linum perenne]